MVHTSDWHDCIHKLTEERDRYDILESKYKRLLIHAETLANTLKYNESKVAPLAADRKEYPED